MENKKRRPIGAALLSIIVPGLGQVYNGQLKKGLIFYFVVFLLPAFVSLTRLQHRFYGMLGLLILGITFYLIIAGEAFIVAKKIKEMTLKSYNKWYYYLLIVILSIGINTITEEGIKAYKIPSGAMIPSILIGDHIIVDLNKYKNNVPQKGDIIVFKYPKDTTRNFIKRVIGVEGDKIESKDKTIFVNGRKLIESYAQHVDSDIIPGQQSPRDNFGPLIIPKGNVFVMGDNRDSSHDS